jgi:predicted metal-dependent phosphoesterase TrpH
MTKLPYDHTVISDGELTHLELLAAAERQGIGVIGFTDHDCVPSVEIMDQLRAYKGPVKWTVGIEISVGLPKELPDWDKKSLHLLGLFIDPQNEAIQEFGKTLVKGRFERMQRVVKHLQAIGFDVTEEDCLRAAGASQLGQPHIVAAVLAKPANLARIAELKSEMAAAAESDPAMKLQYDKMVADGARQEPYTLFMGSKSFKPLAKAPMANIIDFDAGVDLIHQAGGIAIFAHPFFYEDYLSYDDLEKWLRDKRVDGIETEIENLFHQDDSSELFAQMRAIANRTGAIGIASSDAHDEADLETFAERDSGDRSIGQTAAIVERVKPSLEFSNL